MEIRHNNVEEIKNRLLGNLTYSTDVITKSMSADVQLLYIQSICDENDLQTLIIRPFHEINGLEVYESYLQALPKSYCYQDDADSLLKMMQGYLVIFINGNTYLIEIKKVRNQQVLEAKIESTIQGPQNALSEDISTNISLIRHRYRQTTLKIVEQQVGTLSLTDVVMIYDEQFVDKMVLDKVKLSLSGISEQVLQSAGQLQRLLTTQKRSLFPTMVVTERPDRIVYNLSKGKIILVIDGSSFALVIPSVFFDFMSSMEEFYQSYWIGRFLICLRYIGLFISVVLPSIYVAATGYNPEVFRVQLALSVAGSRIGVPYPAFVEVLLMLIMMELLTEASIRLPKSIGSTATTVGGLILGQAATEAGLVSNIMIIIVASVAIANFVIPINEMGFAVRTIKYVILLLSSLLGFMGTVVGVVGLIGYLTNLDSFGQPYLKLYNSNQSENKE